MYGASILIDEKTKKKVFHLFHLRELDTIRVRIKAKPIKIYEVLDHVDHRLDYRMERALKYYENALYDYRNKGFEVARQNFLAAIESADDSPSRVMLRRCEEFLKSPEKLGEKWEGVYDLEGK